MPSVLGNRHGKIVQLLNDYELAGVVYKSCKRFISLVSLYQSPVIVTPGFSDIVQSIRYSVFNDQNPPLTPGTRPHSGTSLLAHITIEQSRVGFSPNRY